VLTPEYHKVCPCMAISVGIRCWLCVIFVILETWLVMNRSRDYCIFPKTLNGSYRMFTIVLQMFCFVCSFRRLSMVFIVYSAVFELLGFTRNLFVHLLDLTRLKVNLARPVENEELELVPPPF